MASAPSRVALPNTSAHVSRRRLPSRPVVLAAVDLDPAAVLVLRTAHVEAVRRRAHLLVMHVVSPVVAPLPMLEGPSCALGVFQGAAVRLLGDLRALVRRSTHRTGRRFTVLVQTGSVADQVARVARDQHAALVVIGRTRGRGVLRALLGGVPQRVAGQLECSLLVVEPPATRAGQ
ncbi:MAG: universal stress protein [Deltaproteobacteria bacterium]|nr:universal stress protein [Deltaproteobacteria bacterium]